MPYPTASPEVNPGRKIPVELQFHRLSPGATLGMVIRSFGAEWTVDFGSETGPFAIASSHPHNAAVSSVSVDPWSIYVTVSQAQDGSLIHVAIWLSVADGINQVSGIAELPECTVAEIIYAGRRLRVSAGPWKMKV